MLDKQRDNLDAAITRAAEALVPDLVAAGDSKERRERGRVALALLVEAVLKVAGVTKLPTEPELVPLDVGNRYQEKPNGDMYILTQVDIQGNLMLVSLFDGVRFDNPVKQDAMQRLLNDKFKLKYVSGSA